MTAALLRALHVPGNPLVLPNVWDAATAREVVAAGYPAIATSSAAVAEAVGYADGEAPADEMFAAAARIARVIDVPLTVDAEAGYRLPAAELAERLRAAGAVGCNIEDSDHDTHVPTAQHAARLRELRDAADTSLVINARVDSFLRTKDHASVLADGIARAEAYLTVGADCVYPIGLRDRRLIAEFVAAVRPAPVNITSLPGGPDLAEAAELGVARVSLGAGLFREAQAWLRDRLLAVN
ncbi:2-methylisocitrate lyase-like PEP mutase family enzyme [Tamaricihabitans halophyticus]|uniref:2-methylisocitrate lyase-like PEP mutase family enzyme n=1 Tax=Tamaricihabitans halophyticus TaxID=1262583 RepID=A0A4R2QSY3_9PSEU|nr:isocitrate lyase/phosphoenolpyruvate mutase family protein [Tamaricihabitans halophyticus]TCP53010.1 2-methylisocitrate lyase-like PEP mutase family enzyme [Tamaricihabitans halophyticus]